MNLFEYKNGTKHRFSVGEYKWVWENLLHLYNFTITKNKIDFLDQIFGKGKFINEFLNI